MDPLKNTVHNLQFKNSSHGHLQHILMSTIPSAHYNFIYLVSFFGKSMKNSSISSLNHYINFHIY